MPVLTIRAHKRYATRLPVELRRAGRKPVSGLLIELSQQGARVSNLGRGRLELGEAVVLATLTGLELHATIRWTHDGLAGMRLDQSLHLPAMRELLELSARGHGADEARYGT